MKAFISRNKLIIIIAIVALCALSALYYYRASKTDLLNNTEYKTLAQEIYNNAKDGKFTCQEDLMGSIRAWADDNGLEYAVNKTGSIVFINKAVARKKKVSPTVICVSCNYQTAGANARLLASAAMIAKADLKSGRKTVIFVNDEQNNGRGYRYLSKKLFSKKAKVIYMDYGNASYMSESSFGKTYSTINIKAIKTQPVCDTAVKIHISGIRSSEIGTEIGDQPDPVAALSSLLSRLKSKSAIFQLADFELGSNGSMHPVSLDATILLNSYAVPSFTKYIDKSIRSWEKAYSDNYEDLEYTYEVIEDPEQMPETSYSRKATEKLTNVLYTLKSGLYKYEDGDDIPEGSGPDDIYGINAVIGLRDADGKICVDLMTQAYDKAYMKRISDDNTAAAELFGCSLEEKYSVKRFLNEKNSLSRTFNSTYNRVNGVFNAGDVLASESDNYFTPCSYLAKKNKNADIIHLRLNKAQTAKLTNAILCYIAFKGNILL